MMSGQLRISKRVAQNGNFVEYPNGTNLRDSKAKFLGPRKKRRIIHRQILLISRRVCDEAVCHLFDRKCCFDGIEGPELDANLALGSCAVGYMAARDKLSSKQEPGAGRNPTSIMSLVDELADSGFRAVENVFEHGRPRSLSGGFKNVDVRSS
jgi:hypothetical protein